MQKIATIELEEMEFYGYHGCFKEEQIVGNKFIVNLSFDVNITIPAKTDNIKDAINYVTVYRIVKEQMSIASHLMENLAWRIHDAIKQAFPEIIKLHIKVSKFNPPVGGKMKQMSINIEK